VQGFHDGLPVLLGEGLETARSRSGKTMLGSGILALFDCSHVLMQGFRN
jgi:hypothetical protein